MAETTITAAQTPEEWDANYFEEYVRESQFADAMGTGTNSIIQLKEQLDGKGAGDTINFQLIKQLTGDGVAGNTTLEGNEESLDSYQDSVSIDWLRNGVKITKRTQKFAPMDLRSAAKDMLKTWSATKLRDTIIDRLMSPKLDGVTSYASALEAEKDAWLAANSDRVLFGAAWTNNAANDHSAALAQIDNTSDKFSPTILSMMKRRAKQPTNGAIRPYRTDTGGEWFVVYAHSLAFRDFRATTTWQDASKYALERGPDNSLFVDGDLIWDGCIVKEVPEIPVVGSVGAGSIQVVPVFLCGAQSLALAWGQRPMSIVDDKADYKFRWGCAIEELRGAKKVLFNNVQHGMMTGYFAGVADT